MKAILLFLCPLLVFSEGNITEESFISHDEYGQMLYKNPRGISCAACHGAVGEGKIIVSYVNRKGKVDIKGIDIRHKTLDEIIIALSASHKVMPRYYLTDNEVKAIYDYLQKKVEKKVKK